MLIRDLTLIILAISVACRRLSRNFQTSRPSCSCHILGSGFDSGPPCLWCVIWPLKQHQIARGNITGVHTIDNKELRREVGWGVRVGAGGLWGGFGWLWTQRRGIVQMYISRTHDFVWIECANGRPWLITPEDPDAFVRALSSAPNAVAQQSVPGSLPASRNRS